MATSKTKAAKVVNISQPKSPKSVTLPFQKTTPGTHVYGTAEREGVICRQVYLVKDEMPGDPPKSITLTVEW